jgi:hypothetical protein
MTATPTEQATDAPVPATPSPAQDPSPPAAATPGADGWLGPDLISTRNYWELSLVVDDAGIAHAAAVLNDGLFYLTNESGSWTRERLTRPDGRDSEPSLALDGDGSLHVAFTRWPPDDPDYCPPDVADCFGPGPEGIFYVTNDSGAWSAPVQLGRAGGTSPSLEMKDGRIHLAYVRGPLYGELGGPAPVRYATNKGGAWSDQRIGDSYSPPQLELSPDGRAHMAFWDHHEDDEGDYWAIRAWYAVADADAGTFSVEELPPVPNPSESWIGDMALALGENAGPHLFASLWSETGSSVHRWVMEGTAWRRVMVQEGDEDALSVDSDALGAVHLMISGGCCTSHVTDRGGQLQTHELASRPGSGDIAVDATGRPHVLFMLHDGRSSELWYGIGPATQGGS